MNWSSADPGKVTGVGIWDDKGKLVAVETVRDGGQLVDYIEKVRGIKIEYSIEFALIENYCNYGRHRPNAANVREQIRVWTDVFENHILILNQQWEKVKYHSRYKKQIVEQDFGVKVNEHGADAVLMGRNVFQFADYRYADGFEYLRKLAEGGGKWPTVKERRKMLETKLVF